MVDGGGGALRQLFGDRQVGLGVVSPRIRRDQRECAQYLTARLQGDDHERTQPQRAQDAEVLPVARVAFERLVGDWNDQNGRPVRSTCGYAVRRGGVGGVALLQLVGEAHAGRVRVGHRHARMAPVSVTTSMVHQSASRGTTSSAAARSVSS